MPPSYVESPLYVTVTVSRVPNGTTWVHFAVELIPVPGVSAVQTKLLSAVTEPVGAPLPTTPFTVTRMVTLTDWFNLGVP